MRIIDNSFETVHQLRFLNAAKRGGVESQRLQFTTAKAEGLPDGIDALVVTSDLQGVAPSWRHGGENVLLGVQVAEELFELADAGKIPDPAQTGVVLAGDLYSAPGGDKRGATGDVRDVWLAFAAMHRWVVGVAGNHDLFGTKREETRLQETQNIELLGGTLVEKDGLLFGGVGYVIGNPEKVGRQEEGEFFAALDLVLDESPDVLILHEGPSGERDQRGNAHIRKRIEESSVKWIVCGHVHWNEPVAELRGSQVVNVDSRVLILTR